MTESAIRTLYARQRQISRYMIPLRIEPEFMFYLNCLSPITPESLAELIQDGKAAGLVEGLDGVPSWMIEVLAGKPNRRGPILPEDRRSFLRWMNRLSAAEREMKGPTVPER